MAQTLAQLRTSVLGDDFDSSKYTTDANQAINDALDDIARQVSLPLLEGTFTPTLIAGTANYNLPTDDVRLLWMTDTDLRSSLDEVSQEWIDSQPNASGRPNVFAQYGGQVVFYPTPDRAYPMQGRYRRDAANLTLDTSDETAVIPDNYAYATVAFARARLFAKEDDDRLSAFWRGEYERELARIKGDFGMRAKGRLRRIPGPYRRPSSPRFTFPGR